MQLTLYLLLQGSLPDYTSVQRLQFLDQCLNESLRLHLLGEA